MFVEIGNEYLKLNFKRTSINKVSRVWTTPNQFVDITSIIRKTECFLISKDKEILYQGESICNIHDTFKKEIGRINALKNMTSKMFAYDKIEVWRIYNGRKKKTILR
jgi:hypothetical protein